MLDCSEQIKSQFAACSFVFKLTFRSGRLRSSEDTFALFLTLEDDIPSIKSCIHAADEVLNDDDDAPVCHVGVSKQRTTARGANDTDELHEPREPLAAAALNHW
jgi:hypothetical protein